MDGVAPRERAVRLQAWSDRFLAGLGGVRVDDPILPAVLHTLEALSGPAVQPVGLVIRNDRDPDSEEAAVVISRYLDYSFSYRELISGAGFGARRGQLLDAFAWLLVELHLLGCVWRDCSLSNVLYRWDADAIETTLVDGHDLAAWRAAMRPNTRAAFVESPANPTMGLVDVYAALLPQLKFSPGVHVHYQESVLPIGDGKPKLRDMPMEMGGSGVNLPE